MRQQITDLFVQVGLQYQSAGLVSEVDLVPSHDIHAFYRLSADPNQVIHLQGYPGMSNSREAQVVARIMQYHKMMDIRAGEDRVSPGNEHAAVLRFLNGLRTMRGTPYSAEVLKRALESDVSELRSA